MSADATSLDRLHDVVTPPAAPWWPPAPGWYGVLGALALGLIVWAAWGLRHWLRNRYRHEALKEFAQLEPALADVARRAEAMTALAILLKRTALSAWPRERVAALTGVEWQTFLNRTMGMVSSDGELAWTLESAAYDPGRIAKLDETQVRAIALQAKQWLARHRVHAAELEEA
jgi:hypothetical protein